MIVVDASVAVKWFVAEPDSAQAATIFAAAERWSIPLVTADARLAAALAATPWRARVTLLRDWRDPGEP